MIEEESKAVKNMSSAELAKLARDVYVNGFGIHKCGLQFLYQAISSSAASQPGELELDSLITILYMSESLIDVSAAVAINEFLLQSCKDDETKRHLQRDRLLRLRVLDLAIHKDGLETPPMEDFFDPNRFRIDEGRVQAMIRDAVGPRDGLRAVFDAVYNKIGLRAGLIKHKQFGTDVPNDELYYSDRFERTDEYAKFLDSTEFELDS